MNEATVAQAFDRVLGAARQIRAVAVQYERTERCPDHRRGENGEEDQCRSTDPRPAPTRRLGRTGPHARTLLCTDGGRPTGEALYDGRAPSGTRSERK